MGRKKNKSSYVSSSPPPPPPPSSSSSSSSSTTTTTTTTTHPIATSLSTSIPKFPSGKNKPSTPASLATSSHQNRSSTPKSSNNKTKPSTPKHTFNSKKRDEVKASDVTPYDVDPPKRVCGFLCRLIWISLLLLFISLCVKITLDPENTEIPVPLLPPFADFPSGLPEHLQAQLKDFIGTATRPGTSLAADGYRAHYPVICMPGIVSTALEVWQGEECASVYFRQRLWGSSLLIRSILTDSRCWLRHISLNFSTGLDPDGIKLRPAMGMEAADYIIGGYWVWAKIIHNLADIGYDPNSMWMAPYDWRLAPPDLELRDYYFTKLKHMIEIAKVSNGNRKCVVVCHSMGGQVFHYFMKWVESSAGGKAGPRWISDHIESVVGIGVPYLGVPKAYSAVFSGEMRDTAELADYLNYWRTRVVFSQLDVQNFMRTLRSVPSMLPKGGNGVWGDHECAPDDEDGISCPTRVRIKRGVVTSTGIKIDVNTTQEVERKTDSGAPVSGTGLSTHSSEKQHKDRGLFVSLSDQHHELTLEQAMELLRESASVYMKHIDRIYSFGAKLPTPERADDSRTWANPLESTLPYAPNMTIYCLYGVGLDTERGYVYHRMNSSSPTDIESSIKHAINTSVTNDSVRINRGVKLGDGDATVPVVSLGYMCAEGWKSHTLNPGGVRVIGREYMEANASLPILRSSTSVDHVDIMGNSEVISDLIKIVGKRYPYQTFIQPSLPELDADMHDLEELNDARDAAAMAEKQNWSEQQHSQREDMEADEILSLEQSQVQREPDVTKRSEASMHPTSPCEDCERSAKMNEESQLGNDIISRYYSCMPEIATRVSSRIGLVVDLFANVET